MPSHLVVHEPCNAGLAYFESEKAKMYKKGIKKVVEVN